MTGSLRAIMGAMPSCGFYYPTRAEQRAERSRRRNVNQGARRGITKAPAAKRRHRRK